MAGLSLTDALGQPVKAAFARRAAWPDGSVRWLRVRLILPEGALEGSGSASVFALVRSARLPHSTGSVGDGTAVTSATDAALAMDSIRLTMGERQLLVEPSGTTLVSMAAESSTPGTAGLGLRLQCADGSMRQGRVSLAVLESRDALGLLARSQGDFGEDCPVRFVVRWRLDENRRVLVGELSLRNTRAAKHPGGCWDLGDAGSWLIRDCALTVPVSAGSVGGPAVLFANAQCPQPEGAGAGHRGALLRSGDPGAELATAEARFEGADSAPDPRVVDGSPVAGDGLAVPTGDALVIYQDSSGGERWCSPNHCCAGGGPTTRVRGFEIRCIEAGADGGFAAGVDWSAGPGRVISRGDRVQPVLGLGPAARAAEDVDSSGAGNPAEGAPVSAGGSSESGIAAAHSRLPLSASIAVGDFWQNFPIALRARPDQLEIAFFPAESAEPVELQGGEQKRWTFAIGLPGASAEQVRAALASAQPLIVDAHTIARSGAVPGFIAPARESDYGEAVCRDDPAHSASLERPEGTACHDRQLVDYLSYISHIVDPEDGFAARRETIDEYGWRNFGELVADHEAVNHTGDEPFITHYNNQYDFVLGAALHALRSGDERWWRLHLEAARHLVDIDIYHTTEDRPAYNGGMFWHTDHYLPAATATHRTYSRRNATGAGYGGGPADEHNYSSGLLLNHWLTGDEDSREAVIGLADWVIAMDDGSHTLWALVDRGPTGLASKTVSADYHGPGRGAGNSILTLLNAWQLTGKPVYMDKANELIRRCIHPADDLAARELDQPEHRWSYLVFLQVLAQYLWLKETAGEFDSMFHYARESLLHYARWVADHEKPYADQLDKVELPTETWPAQDVRKPHVLQAAARYTADAAEAARFRERAEFFFGRCLQDLQRFETCRLTRPLVLLAVFGGWHFWYRRLAADADAQLPAQRLAHVHDFGEPTVFVPQSQRAREAVRHGLHTAFAEVRRLVGDRIRARRG